MRMGIEKCAEIVQNVGGGAPAKFSQNIGGLGFRDNCVHKFCAFSDKF